MKLKEENLPLPMPSKKSHIKLYADECFPVPSATFLKALGYSVIHAYDKVCKKLLKNISEDFAKSSLIKVTIDKVIKIKGGRTILEKDY